MQVAPEEDGGVGVGGRRTRYVPKNWVQPNKALSRDVDYCMTWSPLLPPGLKGRVDRPIWPPLHDMLTDFLEMGIVVALALLTPLVLFQYRVFPPGAVGNVLE